MSWSLSKFIRDNKRTYPKRTTTKDHTMKFSTLSAAHRSALAAIRNAGVLKTDKLAAVMGGGITAQQAAHQLCAMRKAGLVFSHQKDSGAQYCRWEVTTLGEALFNGRPGAELVFKHGDEHAVTKYAVIMNFQHQTTGTREQALLAAKHKASEGIPCTVIGLVADVVPPEQPLPVVTLL